MDQKDVGTFGLLFYNSIFSLPLLLVSFIIAGEWTLVVDFEWRWQITGTFLLSSLMGFLLNLSIFLCTKVNSPLTTTVI
eukprot:Awhi_evm1s78